MIRTLKNITFFIVLVLNSPSFSQPAQAGNINRMVCKSDTNQQYALYLPKNYDDTSLHPLLIFLDPVARGHVPLLKYRAMADETGIIMAGSYNSRNFDPLSSQISFVAIYNDIVNKYPVQADAVWLSGFSGGARAAGALAMIYSEITGVIACGAGFPDDAINPALFKSYAAIAGKKDMNYTELLDNSRFLDSAGARNILLTFEGGHEWPDTNYMGLAIEWLGQSYIPYFIAGRCDTVLEKAVTDWKAGFYYQSWLVLEQLAKIESCRAKALQWVKIIASMKEFAEDKKLFEEAGLEETNCLNKFSLLLTKLLNTTERPDKKEWKQYAADLTMLAFNGNKYMQPAAVRCSDHIYRSVAESYFHLMDTGEFEKALADAEVLTYFNPPEINPWFLMARAAAMMEKKKWAIKYLKEAAGQVNFNKEQMLNDKILLRIFSQEDLETLPGK